MATITVIEGSADATREDTVQVQSTEVTFKIVRGSRTVRLQPALVTNVDITNSEEMSTISDQCGRTETRGAADLNWDIAVEGLVTKDSNNPNRFDLQDLKTLKGADELTIISDIHTGPVIVREISISQTNDLVSIDVGDGDELAFPFQLQLREPQPNR